MNTRMTGKDRLKQCFAVGALQGMAAVIAAMILAMLMFC